ncbi:MAG: staygreen family protein [Candidatus Thorarchaeota archaeon]
MRRLNPTKLHVRFINPANETGPIIPRCYTLTHSDRTGELFLTIGPEYNQKQIRGWYTRFMRDEVLAEWVSDPDGYELHVHCEIERGFGSVSFREGIFRRELDLVLEAFRYGDRQLVEVAPILDSSHIKIRFHLRNSKDDYIEDWGTLSDYR